jgi:hypothetical protein
MRCKLCLLDLDGLPWWAGEQEDDICSFCLASLEEAERFMRTNKKVAATWPAEEEEVVGEVLFSVGELDFSVLGDLDFASALPLENGKRQLVYGRRSKRRIRR